MDYTAIGDTVNLASRLDGANKFFHTRVLLARSTYDHAGAGDWLARSLGNVQVVGKQEAVELWNLLGRRASAPAELVRACDAFAAGLEHFHAARFAQAGELFRTTLELLPDDGPSQTYADLCKQYQAAPPPEGWQVVRLSEK